MSKRDDDDAQHDDAPLLDHAYKTFTPVTLPCGRVVPNRLVKAPLYEHFASLLGGPPHEGHFALYSRWAAGGWGMIVTGNVQVDKRHISLGRDMVIPESVTPETLAPWRRLADVIHSGSAVTSTASSSIPDSSPHGSSPSPQTRTLAILQLSHSGRQSLNIIGGRKPFEPPLAPSPIRLGAGHGGRDDWFSRFLHHITHQVPREMTKDDIKAVIAAFVRGAQVAAKSGFDGVQVHAGHGYLLTQFISPKCNVRTDEYSAHRDPLRLLREIVYAIRAPGIVPEDFVVGVKLNAADYVRDAATPQQDRALDHVREIGSWGLLDYIEVTGGDYEDPQFIDTTRQFKSPRQVVFESFAQRSIEILSESSPGNKRPRPLICLTGGINTLPRMVSILANSHADLLGLGRLSILHPLLPVKLYASLQKRAAGEKDSFLMEPPRQLEVGGLGIPPPSYLSWRGLERLFCHILTFLWSLVPLQWPRIVNAGQEVSWYNIMLRRVAFGQEVDYTIGTVGTVFRFCFGIPPRPPRGDYQWIRWWMLAGCLGVAIGVCLGQVL
ncbi:hypothetical protein BD414DRAFT_502565 [Trametes punicea]|nr:hypothetical protein BD414DRAFT_502565 [Trametes punicea]